MDAITSSQRDATVDTTSSHIGSGIYVSELAGIEHQLASALTETTDEFKHVECFDNEQRAEIYTILQALRDDTEAHRAMVDLLAHQLKTGGGASRA